MARGRTAAASLRALATYYGMSESLLLYGVPTRQDLSLAEVLQWLPRESKRQALDFLLFVYRAAPRAEQTQAVYEVLRKLAERSRQETEPA